jgi:nitrogen-specific signal transduction histidine kinase/ActR/RegA family two-component response regulator
MVINEVTREREIQAQLQQQERLAAIGQLAAGIAHDFNNIMASIVLYSQMVARSQALSEREREKMKVITQQAWHATRLIQQILDFSRRAVLERQPLDLLPLLKEHIKLLERTLPEHIIIELACPTDTYIVNADPTRIQQMLTNLAVNARDAMPEGGTLRIELTRVILKPNQIPFLTPITSQQTHTVETKEWLRLTVSDTGDGIPAEILPHIFEPFFTTKEPGKGSGLGLPQVHGIVGQHGGHIDVTTQIGKGSTFTIYLPALEVHQPTTPPPDVAEIFQGHHETVLVVEDDATLRSALLEILEMLNYQTLEAENGQQALEMMKTQGEHVALVLSDVVMPKMGGMALFHTLKEQNWQIPVVLLTGHPMNKELEALRDKGLCTWLLKPPNIEELAQAIAKALRKTSTK